MKHFSASKFSQLSSTYDSRGSGSASSRLDSGNSMNKDSRYSERSGADFRGGRNDDRNGSNKPRYIESSESRYSDNRNSSSWSNSGPPQVKPFSNISTGSNEIWNKASGGNDGWRASGMDNNQDRYDRNSYNDRKTGVGSQFMDTSRPGFISGGPVGGGNRYPGHSVSRYENGRF